jgi:hypothetical protein
MDGWDMVTAPDGTMNGKLEYRAFNCRSRDDGVAVHCAKPFLRLNFVPYGLAGGTFARATPAGPETAHNEFGR